MTAFNINSIKVGQDVKVKKGIKDPDFSSQLIEGWQGTVIEIDKKEGLIDLEWDVKTLLNTPYQYLHNAISKGYDHEVMTLSIEDLEPAQERTTTPKDQSELYAKLYWIDFFGVPEVDQVYAEIFKDVDVEDELAMLKKWEEHLTEELAFPFEVEVAETEGGNLRLGTKFQLTGLHEYDEMYGVFGIGKSGRGAITFPICNLEATNQDSNNHGILHNYVVWFANR